MSDDPMNYSLQDLFARYSQEPLLSSLKYLAATDYDDKFAALEQLVDRCYRTLVDDRADVHGESEDQLSIRIVQMLKFANVQAEHDTKVGGHCDIVVKGPDSFLWIGEAKIHKSYQWLEDGFMQLTTRYATGAKGRNRGEIIIYHTRGNSVSVLREWMKKVCEEFSDVDVTEDINDGELCFRTVHNCPNSGLPFHVRHSIVPLMFDPKK